MTNRLAPQAGEVVNRSECFSFTWNGATFPAFAGDTIVSALAACGVRVFWRSYKYHRPRGILTADYLDPSCTMQVGDEPNVRGAHRLVKSGMDVKAQNAWPSLRFDLKSANQLMARFMGPGFYYKTFMWPRRWWPAYERVLRRFIAGGEVDLHSARGYYDKRYAHPDVLVAGGGPAGMAAAVAAAKTGARVMLVEEGHQLGGHLRWGDETQLKLLDQLRGEVLAQPEIEVLTDSVVTGRYDGNWVAVVQRNLPGVVERLIKARAKMLIVAPGLIERPYVFEGNDLPGVMLSGAVRRLINLYAVRPGSRAVVFTANDEGDRAAVDLRRTNVEVAAIVDARRGDGIVRAYGRGQVRGVELANGVRVGCDLLVVAAGWTAPGLLLNMAGDRPRYDAAAARFFPGGKLPDDVFAVGGLAGDGSMEELIGHAQAVGQAAAAGAGYGSRPAIPQLAVHSHPSLFRSRTHGMVDWCEDVSSADICSAVKEGYDSIELVKRYTTSTMGPTQGKLETINTMAIVAEMLGQTIEETGTTVWRPPYAPITLGGLAGRHMEPTHVSPMQPWHEAHQATPLIAGRWIRPEHYGNPPSEVTNTRTNVGIIDVTPLGKYLLHGPDTVKLLNLLYVNDWSTLAVGSAQYGLMCGEDGVVLDDGVTARIASDEYFMTTTSSGAAAVGQWIESWLQGSSDNWRVHVVPATDAFASMNVAGPKSAELLQRLTQEVDLHATAFPYMGARKGRVAGVDGCYLLRLGFTGELSYELHVPAGFGQYIWETLIECGRDLGIEPFGIEAQRIMRLEKGHVIVGQDTDGLTQVLSLGLKKFVKLGKPDFVGKPELKWQMERNDYPRLIGLWPNDPGLVPPEASLIVQGTTIVGRITSSRMSPTLRRSICMALLREDLSKAGTSLTIRLPNGQLVPAQVTERRIHFDPQGTRLHG
ncbi:MAG TPA: 2Fe-2S iron-sulfur cluster-binding protein [Candidatus Binataceae bacterium]|nr:2Fe-2S iron-sulfur cluster-binding protein [Candidatus Binataceae bacterium]